MSPPMDFGSSSQETVSNLEMEIQPRGAARCESRETGPPSGVVFMCGLDDDSSQSGGQHCSFRQEKKIETGHQ